MRGNFNLSSGISYCEYGAVVDSYYANAEKRNKAFLNDVLKFLGINRKRKEIKVVRGESSPYYEGQVAIFTSYEIGGKSLGVNFYKVSRDDYYRLIFGKGEYYTSMWDKKFSIVSSADYAEVEIPEDLVEKYLKNDLNEKEFNQLLNILIQFKDKMKNWLEKNTGKTIQKSFIR